MSNENMMRTGFALSVFLAVFIYHIIGTVAPSDPDALVVVRIVQVVVASIFSGFVFFTQLIPWIFRASYIGGTYRGRSFDFEIEPPEPKAEFRHDESFAIRQTLFETIIDGESHLVDTPIAYSTWHGRRFKVEGSTHYFGIWITSPGATNNPGVLQLMITDGRVNGFYFSGDPTSTKRCKIEAERSTGERGW